MLCNSWNVNVRIMLDLPRDTHCYIVEELDNGPHVRQMLFSRYIKFLNNIYNGRRENLKFLLNLVSRSMYSPTGVNIHQILTETGVKIIPGRNNKSDIKNHRVYSIPEEEKWRISLITGIMEIREQRWEILFDSEDAKLNDEDIQTILHEACSSR